MAGKKKDEGEEKAPRGKKKTIVVAGLAALLLAGGTGGGVFFLTKGDSASAATKEVVEPVAGAVVPLDPISLNLADDHYLKIGIALQAVESGGESSKGPDGSKALDLTIGEFSGLSMADLSNPEQRQHHQDQLQEKIVKAYTTKAEDGTETEAVMGIYLTQFVMQ